MTASGGSDWSDPVFVFPTGTVVITDQRLFYPEVVASFPLKTYGSGDYDYTICTGTITSSVPWDLSAGKTVAGTIEDAIKVWEQTIRWVTGGANIIETTGTWSEQCPFTRYVVFMEEEKVVQECKKPNAFGCERNGTIILRGRLDGLSDIIDQSSWSDILPEAGCSLLHAVVLHEAGHAIGVSDENHARLTDTVMYTSLFSGDGPYCTPQPYDIAAGMAYSQSR